MKHKDPWTWFVTRAQPSAFFRPAVSNRNITPAPNVILHFLNPTLKNV